MTMRFKIKTYCYSYRRRYNLYATGPNERSLYSRPMLGMNDQMKCYGERSTISNGLKEFDRLGLNKCVPIGTSKHHKTQKLMCHV